MISDLCLSIDLGTGGPKVGLVTLDGEIVAHEVHVVSTTLGPGGAATQDANEWWSIIAASTRRLLEHDGVTGERVKVVAVTGQYASTVPVDANGVPTGPCLTWMDTRGGPFSRAAFGGPIQGYNPIKLRHFIKKTAGAPVPSGGDPVGQMLYMMNREPELVAATPWFLEPVDYLTLRFTGVAAATHASNFSTWLCDTRSLTTYDYDDGLLAMVGVAKDRLAPLVPIGSVVGDVTPQAAGDLGLVAGTPVITGLLDLHAAAAGAGSTRTFDTHLALSTTSWISCPVAKKKTDINHTIITVPGLTNDSYLVFDQQDLGAKALEWYRSTLASTGALPSYDELTALAATAPGGANGVVFTPWLSGQLSPSMNSAARGGFSNLSVSTTGADMARAVLEGVATNSAWLLGYVEKFAGQRLGPVHALGGGAQSSLWCQILADALDREVEQVPDAMVAQLRGAAMLASVALGVRTLDQISTDRRRGVTFAPRDEHRDLFLERRALFPTLFRRERRRSKQ